MKNVAMFVTAIVLLTTLTCAQSKSGAPVPQRASGVASTSKMSVTSEQTLVNEYCVGCHNDKLKSGGFSWTEVNLANPGQNAERLERVIRKVRAGMMPPAGARRPDWTTLKAFASGLETGIDQAEGQRIAAPNLHRLNRTEYHNSIHDLLDLDIDVTEFLPPDAKTAGFDNIAEALTVTPTLMQAYIRSAEKISRLAIGDPQASPAMVSYKVSKVVNQMGHIEGTPFGTRGGMSVIHNFPVDGDYTFKAELYFNVTGGLVGAALPESLQDQQLEISVDGQRVGVFPIDPATQETDSNLVTEPVHVKAGPRRIAAAFVSKFDGPIEDQYRLVDHTLVTTTISNVPRMTVLPHLQNVFITGPLKATGVSGTPSREKIFSCHPARASEEETCATAIISRLAANAFRRPVVAEDMESLLDLYREGRKEGDFEAGIRLALQGILAKPAFVFRFEPVPPKTAPGQTYSLTDLELASRLSYFLWSSVPDEELISEANKGNLVKNPAVFEREVRRMLASPRSKTLTTNFATQWLRLVSITEINPDASIFPMYTDNLGVSMRKEIEFLFDSIVHEDRNVLDLLTADYTFVNQTLAEFYGIPNVVGLDFRRVPVTDPNRIGLIGKAGFLRMTSLANRTTPVGRGKYILEVLIGTPPPTPPPNVPPLKEAAINEKVQSVRGRMEQHRKVEPCRSCHQIMDPIGLALENYDAIGRPRAIDNGLPIDSASTMYDGTKLDGIVGVRQAILNHSEAFLGNFSERLLTYSLGRVLDYRDMPTVRSITREAAKENNRLSAFVMAIVKNPSFRMTKNPESQH